MLLLVACAARAFTVRFSDTLRGTTVRRADPTAGGLQNPRQLKLKLCANGLFLFSYHLVCVCMFLGGKPMTGSLIENAVVTRTLLLTLIMEKVMDRTACKAYYTKKTKRQTCKKNT